MLALSEKQMLVQALGRIVVEEVQIAIAPIKEKMLALEKVLGDMPVPQNGLDGKDGKDGADGKAADLGDIEALIRSAALDAQQWVRDYVSGALDALPKAEKGERGEKGEKGDPGKDGKDGRDGVDGVDGRSVSLDDVRALLADLVAKALRDIPIRRDCVGGFIDRRGHLFLSFSDGCNSDLGEVVGRDGKDCDPELVRSQITALVDMIEKPRDGRDGKDGIDGVGFDDLQLEWDGERLVTFKFVKGDNAKVFNIVFPLPIYKGVWVDGEYQQSDVVVRSGSMWIATKDTKTEPRTANSDWKLCVKSGRDGKDGKQGPQGPEGKAGRNGRDLTQLGQDGSKW